MKNGDSLSSYQQAEEFFQFWLNPSHQMVKNDVVLSCWIKDSHCFCYIKQTQNGKEYRLVDAKAATNITAFDHGALANILGQERAQEIDPDNLPIHDVFIELSPLRVFFTAFNKSWLFNSESNCCREVDKLHSMSCNAYSDDKTFLPLSPFLGRGYCLESPSGALSVFVSDHNLWLKNQKTGEKTQLTKDGEKGNSYGGGLFDHAVPALWSPDSCHLICARWDDSAASDSTLDLVPDDGLPWRVRPGRKALSGDEHIESLELITIDISTGNISTPDYPLLMQVSSIGAQRPGFFRVNMAWWSTDNRTAYFVDVARGAKSVRVVEWDTRTERTRVLLEESTSTFCSLSHSCNFDRPSMLPLPDSNELIWFSERSGWAHLYLYCLATGELKQTITKGNWLVRDVLHFDLRSRELLLQTAGRNTGINPYYRDICKVNIDTGELTTLASGNYDYCVYHYISDWVSNWSTMVGLGGGIVNNAIHGISPCGHYLVATRSRVDMPPETLLIGRHGKRNSHS